MNKSGSALFFLSATAIVLTLLFSARAVAAEPATSAPSFWDPNLRPDRPDISNMRAIRFLTSDDYPPLNFTLADGALAGFNVEIARAICDELDIACTIQSRPWDTLLDSLQDGKGDAVIASIAPSVALRERVDFSHPYYQTPAHFIARKSAFAPNSAPSADTLAGKTVGVVSGSAHEAYLKTFFPTVARKPYDSVSALEAALRDGEVPVAFADGLTFAVWLNGSASADCCAFYGGPYTESRFFGEGVGVVVRKDDDPLRRALDWALNRLASKGVYAEIYLKYFPIGFY